MNFMELHLQSLSTISSSPTSMSSATVYRRGLPNSLRPSFLHSSNQRFWTSSSSSSCSGDRAHDQGWQEPSEELTKVELATRCKQPDDQELGLRVLTCDYLSSQQYGHCHHHGVARCVFHLMADGAGLAHTLH